MCICKLYSLFVALALALQITTTTSKHLAEKPPYLIPCDFNDANLNACVAKIVQVLFTQWKDGVPGLKTVSPLEPMSIKRVKLQQNVGQTINLDADLEDITVYGASQAVIKSTEVDKKSLGFGAIIDFPNLRGSGKYAAKGSVLGLNINGRGTGTLDTRNVRLQFHVPFKVRSDASGLSFIDIVDFKAKIVEVGGARINLENLFGGQKELEASANDLFNQSWRELLGVLTPPLEKVVETLLKDRFKKIFAYVPADYFFTNLPK